MTDARDILGVVISFSHNTQELTSLYQDSNRIQQYFSSEKQPTLWRALPALEELQTRWEKKRDSAKYDVYGDALDDGLAKIGKYYSRLDEKPAFVLALSKISFLRVVYRRYSLSFPKYFIHTTNWLTSNLLGVVLKNKPLRLRREISMRRIGKTRPKSSSRKP